MGEIASLGVKWQTLSIGQGRELGSRGLGECKGHWKERLCSEQEIHVA